VSDIHNDFDIVDREVSRVTSDGALKPVVINARDEVDDFALLEAQFSLVLRLKVMPHSMVAGLLHTYTSILSIQARSHVQQLTA
jgi:hypothetical protein